MSAAGVIVARQNKYIRRFRNAGATSPMTARTLQELGLSESWTFRRMAGRGVFVDVGGGRFYMDPVGADQFLAVRWVKMIIAVIVGLIILALTTMHR